MTDDQYDEMNRILEGAYLEGQGAINNLVQQDLRQQQFQMSLQRDIERGLSNNPESFANLPMPRAEFDLPMVRPPAAVSRSANPGNPIDFLGTLREAQRTGRTMDEVEFARQVKAAKENAGSTPNASHQLEQGFGMLGIPQSLASAIRSVEEHGVLGAVYHSQDNPELERTRDWMAGNAEAMYERAEQYSDGNPLGVALRMDASDAAMYAGAFPRQQH